MTKQQQDRKIAGLEKDLRYSKDCCDDLKKQLQQMQVQVKDKSRNELDISISAIETAKNKDTSTVFASIHNTEVAVSNIATEI